KALGYDPRHPVMQGARPRIENHTTLLICAHAAGKQLFGAERCLVDVVDACSALSMNVLVSLPCTVNTAYVQELRLRAHKVFCVPTTVWQADMSPCPHATARLMDIMRSERVDLVHSNTVMLLEPLLAARFLGLPAVL